MVLRSRGWVVFLLIGALSGAAPLLAAGGGGVSGHVLNAGGHPLAGLRVELVEAFEGRPLGVPIQANVSDERGAWSFAGVPAGEYVVRTSYRDRTTGVGVSVSEGSAAPGILIVAPSLPPSQAFSQAQSGAASGGAAAGTSVVKTLLAAAAVATGMIILVRRDAS